jgi:hypothetical protein
MVRGLMAQDFNTGLSLAQRTLLRNAVVGQLAPLLRSNGGFLASVKPVTVISDTRLRDLDPEAVAEFKLILDGGGPAIAVGLGRGIGEKIGQAGPHVAKTIDVHIYALSNNARGALGRMVQDAASLASNVVDPGVEAALELAEDLLQGYQVGDAGGGTIHGLDWVEEDELLTLQDLTIWRAKYEVKAERMKRRGKGITQAIVDLRARQIEAYAATSAETTFTVASWDPDLLVLAFDDDLPGALAVGDRLTLVAAADGAQQLVTISDIPAADSVELAAAPTVAPVAGDTAYPTQNPLSDVLSTL